MAWHDMRNAKGTGHCYIKTTTIPYQKMSHCQYESTIKKPMRFLECQRSFPQPATGLGRRCQTRFVHHTYLSADRLWRSQLSLECCDRRSKKLDNLLLSVISLANIFDPNQPRAAHRPLPSKENVEKPPRANHIFSESTG